MKSMAVPAIVTASALIVALMPGLIEARRETQPPKEQVERLTLAPGTSPTVRKGTVVGYASQAFQFPGRKGQVVSVDLRTTNTSLYFNLRPAESPEAVYASDRGETGNKADITLPADGDYRVDVYLFRSAARRGAKAPYTASIDLKDGLAPRR